MAVESVTPPRTRPFTADEVWRMVDAGILGEDERLELLDGELVVVTPSGWEHALVVEELDRHLWLIYGQKYTVRVQSVMTATPDAIPEPDITVRPAAGSWTAERRHPRIDEALLVIEVSVSSARVDRRKAAIYARAGAPVYWIVDVPRRCVVVHQGPRRDGTWTRVETLPESQAIEVPGTDARLAIGKVLPPPGEPLTAPPE